MPTCLLILQTLTLSFSILISQLPLASSVNFTANFQVDDQNILYGGGAKRTDSGTVELTTRGYYFDVGRVIYAHKVPLWDNRTRNLSHFTSHFSFTIDIENSPQHADGIAFFLAPFGFEIPPNSGGSNLGLFNRTTALFPSRNQIVLVEFDSRANTRFDPNFEHVGINKNSIASEVTTSWNATFHSGDIADVWISYNATTIILSVSWSYRNNSNPQEKTNLSYPINLTEVLPPWITVGISAATGLWKERHILRSWEFSSSLEVDEKNDKQNGTSVVVDSQKGISVEVVVGLAVLSGVSIIISVVMAMTFLWKWKQKNNIEKEKGGIMASINVDLQSGAGPREFSYSDLAKATDNFSNDRKLGRGGFGDVYKGYLKGTNTDVAVKKILRGSRQGREEYITEVKVISRLRHRNLVQLIGWCHQRGDDHETEKLLIVYEYMPNGSLDSHLFGKRERLLTWGVRYNITLGLASALLYLHEGWEQCVVHRDIKTSNVMLDSKFNAKLGDFGLARLRNHELAPQTTKVAGTLGYMAPEYVSTGRASKVSDVYSFGVVVLEIATGRTSVDPLEKEYQMGFVEWVWDVYGRGELLSIVDKRLERDFDQKQAVCLMLVGLWCCHPDPIMRLSIKQAIHVLKFETPLPDPPSKMPTPTFLVTAAVAESGSSSGGSITTSLNEAGR